MALGGHQMALNVTMRTREVPGIRRRELLLSALGLALIPLSARADTYPSRTIRLIVPFAAGGGTDILARVLSSKMSEQLGKAMFVDNRVGAGGIVGTQAVANADADGYTLLLGAPSSMTLLPLLQKNLPFDAKKDFVPITFLGVAPTILVVNSSLPVKNTADFIAYAKANPGKLNYASGGIGSTIHVAGEMLKAIAGIDMVHVPYKGSGEAMTDLIANRVQVMFSNTIEIPTLLSSGKITPLAVGSTTRSAAFPDLPTLSDSGVPGFECTSWFGLFAPAKTPADVVSKLGSETRKALADNDLKKKFAEQGIEARGSTQDELAKYMGDESARYAKVIQEANIKVK